MVHTERCTKMVAEFEGFRSHPYQDQGGVWTIGYGHAQGVHPNTPPCTEEQALIWLDIDLHTADDALTTLLKVPVAQNQWDALCSFVYNVGYGNFSGSTMRVMLNAGGSKEAIANQFLAWCHVDGVKNAGLTNRRNQERRMFLGEI